jgi:hypothetical protein
MARIMRALRPGSTAKQVGRLHGTSEDRTYPGGMAVRWAIVTFVALAAGFAIGWFARSEPQGPPSSTAPPGLDPVSVFGGERAITANRDEPEMPALRADSTRVAGPDSPLVPGADVVEPLREAYRRISGGATIPDAVLARRSKWLAGSREKALDHQAKEAWHREKLRTERGSLSTPARVVLQVRTESSAVASAGWVPPSYVDSRKAEVPTTPLAWRTAPTETSARATHVEGPLIPEDRLFLVETVRVHAAWPAGEPPGTYGFVTVDLGGPEFTTKQIGTWSTVVRRGRWRLDAGAEEHVELKARNAGAEVILEGRLVAPDSEEADQEEAFRVVSAEGDGYLTGDPILFQIQATHHERRLYLDGSDGFLHATVEHDLWNEHVALEDLERPAARVRGTGAVPPGKVFEIQRVTWRARLKEGEGQSKLTIATGGSDGVVVLHRTSGAKGPASEGSWSGSIVLDPDEGPSFWVGASFFVIAEVWVHGTLRDETR